MLFNPFTTSLPTNTGTRALREDFVYPLQLVGRQLFDPKEPWRLWTVQWLYAPLRKRSLGGIRTKLVDSSGYVTFCNQRDLETLLGLGPPGQRVPWERSEYYLEPSDPDWYGLCADADDLEDDLYERELHLRYAAPDYCAPLPQYSEIHRLVHYDEGNDYAELYLLRQDSDNTFEHVAQRWTRVDKQRM
jgi:hypothetical protein